MRRAVLVAMSGGVDSSVAALRLVEAGFRVAGVTLRLWDSCGRPGARSCCALEDAADAREVARHLGIEHRYLDHAEAFERLVVEPFARAYASGRTPNPCVLCNEFIKFGTLWEYARSEGFDHLATGHHARLEPGVHGAELRRGADPAKDQSYVLFPLTAAQREACLFPVGDIDKGEVRRLAARAGLPTAEKGESQDICFIPAGDYAAFLEGRGLGSVEGEIRHVDGRLLGRHGGVHRFTVGQRRGIGVPAPEPLYVVRLDGLRGEVVVGPRRALEAPGLLVSGWVWHRPGGARPDEVLVQTRYRQEPAGAALLEGREGVVIRWAGRPLPAAPGQAAVAYLGDTVVGGGWIEGVLEGPSP